MKIRSGIKLLQEIEGYGDPIKKGDRFEAVYKFYRNKGDPIILNTYPCKPIPQIVEVDGKNAIGWLPMEMVKSHVVYEHNGWLVRQSDMLVGLYYSIIGMRKTGYRKVKIAPPFMSDSAADWFNITKGSIIVVEIFLINIIYFPISSQSSENSA